jgi:hypothetical protein
MGKSQQPFFAQFLPTLLYTITVTPMSTSNSTLFRKSNLILYMICRNIKQVKHSSMSAVP